MPKVLVVDDSLSVRKVVEKALEGRSVHVLCAASGTEALARIEEDRPDLVVCDVILPDKDGYQICEFVRTHPVIGKIPVLLISGVVNSTVLARAAEVQSNDVMFKPFAADELVRKIDNLLAGRLNGVHAPTPALPRPLMPSPAAAPPAPAQAPVMTTVTTTAPPPTTSLPTSMPAPASAAELAPEDLKGRLEQLVGTPGVRFAALSDREGFLIEWAGEVPTEVQVAGALAACLAESSEGIGRELGQGTLQGMILEYERGTLLLHSLGSTAQLAVLVVDPAALGKVRYYIKKALPELQRAL
jgi:CheY-like chemotaxis protein/predicted regulator of Ras-like GTPase activity (Roadblock/LC7/MglB family)